MEPDNNSLVVGVSTTTGPTDRTEVHLSDGGQGDWGETNDGG